MLPLKEHYSICYDYEARHFRSGNNAKQTVRTSVDFLEQPQKSIFDMSYEDEFSH